jgi:hypothetical protein
VAALLLKAGPVGADAQTFVPYAYVDPAAGLEAFRLLVPKGWKAQGAIAWSANPAFRRSRASASTTPRARRR